MNASIPVRLSRARASRLLIALWLSCGWLTTSLALASRYDNLYATGHLTYDPGTDPPTMRQAELQLKQGARIACFSWVSAVGAVVAVGVLSVVLFTRTVGPAPVVETITGLLLVGAGMSYLHSQYFGQGAIAGPPNQNWLNIYRWQAERRLWQFLWSGPLALAVVQTAIHWRRWFPGRSSITRQRGFDVIPK